MNREIIEQRLMEILTLAWIVFIGATLTLIARADVSLPWIVLCEALAIMIFAGITVGIVVDTEDIPEKAEKEVEV